MRGHYDERVELNVGLKEGYFGVENWLKCMPVWKENRREYFSFFSLFLFQPSLFIIFAMRKLRTLGVLLHLPPWLRGIFKTSISAELNILQIGTFRLCMWHNSFSHCYIILFFFFLKIFILTILLKYSFSFVIITSFLFSFNPECHQNKTWRKNLNWIKI